MESKNLFGEGVEMKEKSLDVMLVEEFVSWHSTRSLVTDFYEDQWNLVREESDRKLQERVYDAIYDHCIEGMVECGEYLDRIKKQVEISISGNNEPVPDMLMLGLIRKNHNYLQRLKELTETVYQDIVYSGRLSRESDYSTMSSSVPDSQDTKKAKIGFLT